MAQRIYYPHKEPFTHYKGASTFDDRELSKVADTVCDENRK